MNPKPSTSQWQRCETIPLCNATGLIFWTGEHYRAQLEIDPETTKALKLKTSSKLLTRECTSVDEAKEVAQNAAEILENMKAGVK